MTENPAFIAILQETRKLLAFHRSVGIKLYPATDQIKSLAGGESVTPPPPGPACKRPAPRQATPSAPPTTDSSLEEIRIDLGECQRCPLHEGRSKIVFGSGSPKADLFIVGEWPDGDEDETGLPFQGETGILLDRMLAAIGLSRDRVYLANIAKCRPREDRQPDSAAIKSCLPFLVRQIQVVAPKVICAMGPVASQTLLHSKQPLSRLRGRFHTFHGVDLMPTFHPAFLIANPDMKKATWYDLQMIQKRCAKP